MCGYMSYNVHLQSEWCAGHLGETLSIKTVKAFEAMDKPDNVPELDRICRLVGRKLLNAEHFDRVFDWPVT
jgi:hypothetical protein